MEKNLNNMQLLNFNKSVEKAIRKYTLEVDDAIEAHGFKATSCIDYAEDVIFELENSIKKHFQETNSNLLFKDLENSLNDTIQNIVNYTKEDAIYRNNYCSEKLDKKADELYSVLTILNSRFLTSLNIL